MEIVGDVMDGKEERNFASVFLIRGLGKRACEGSAPFVAQNGVTFEICFFGVGEGRRGEECEPDVVVGIRGALRRAVDIGPAEIFLIVNICVQRVLIGHPDFVGLVLELFDV